MTAPMRIVTFSAHGDVRRVGMVIGDDVADLSANGGPASAIELLTQPDWQQRATSLANTAPREPLDTVTLAAPVPRPPKFLAIGLNARDHRREVSLRWLAREPRLIALGAGYLLAHPRPKIPYFFAKATSSVTGPNDPIILPSSTSKVDWEGELAVIIGAPLLEADVDEARHGIAGYTITNDVSVRDLQFDNPTATNLAKGYPSHGPLGPWLVPASDFDEDSCELRTYLNGELRQQGRITDLILGPAEIASRLSQFCLLEPGDVIACGTFAGIGWAAGRLLKPGDRVRIEVDGIGHIDNLVISHPRDTE